MPSRTYDEVLDLFRNGGVAEAEEMFNALHADARTRQQQSSARRAPVHAAATESDEKRPPVSDGIAYYQVVNGKKDGPYCQNCYDAESRLEKLRPLNAAIYLCLSCQRECARNLCG